MSKRRIKNWLKRIRNQKGVYLVELLVALFIAGYLTAILGSNLAEIMSLTSATQQTQVANAIAQEIIERLDNLPYGSLPPDGLYNVRINNGDAGDTNSYSPSYQLVNRALQLDSVNLTYTTGNASLPMPTYMFGSNIEANAQLTLKTNETPLYTLATVTVSWVSGANGTHSYSCQYILAPNGI